MFKSLEVISKCLRTLKYCVTVKRVAMPRKTSQAAKKDVTSSEAKSDGDAPRRSGRAAIKHEVTPVKDASRSRRSSTAAQTAASVADSKTPKGRVSISSQRENASPSSSRSRRRESAESPTVRIKSARKSASLINYKESDGEEEAPNPKFDSNFVSEEEFDESDSDEKSKPKGKAKAVQSSAKRRSPKGKGKSTVRSRRGRPAKKQESEEETFEVTDDSAEIEETALNEKTALNEETTLNEDIEVKKAPKRRRRQKSDIMEEKTPVSKGSRRSSRTTSKEESPRKRSSRVSSQVKHYADDDDDDDEIEEISDMKKKEEDNRESQKRKRELSPEDANKRLKEETIHADQDKKSGNNTEEILEKNSVDTEECEPMEVDQSKDIIPPEGEVSNIPTKENLGSDVDKKDKSLDTDLDVVLNQKNKDIEKTECKEQVQSDFSSLADTTTINESSIVNVTGEKNQICDSINLLTTQNKTDFQSTELDKSCVKEKSLTDSFGENADPICEAPDISDSKAQIIDENPSFSDDNVQANATTSEATDQMEDTSVNGSENTPVQGNITEESIKQTSAVNFVDNKVPKANGEHSEIRLISSNIPYSSPPGRKYFANSKISESVCQSVKEQTFGFASLNLGSGSDVHLQKEKLLTELNSLNAHIICLQQVQKPFYASILDPTFDALGFKSIFSQPDDSLKGMVTFYKSSVFRLSGQSEVSLKHLIDKELEASSLDAEDKTAVKTHVKRCGNVLFTHLCTVTGSQPIIVANVQIPPTDLSVHALQVSCLAQEVVRINGGTNKPLLLGGEFNIAENDASYQLLRDGYLSNVMIEELQRRIDVVLPGKENSSLVNLLWKSFQHPSSNLCSCYKSVLDHELSIPEQKSTSADLLWYSSDSLFTIGVLDVASEGFEDSYMSLKADVAFSI